MSTDSSSCDSDRGRFSRLVLSGGGHKGLIQFGALRCLAENTDYLAGVTDFYGTSVGSLNIIYLTLPIPLDYMDDYIAKRPWHRELNLSVDLFVGALREREGVMDHAMFDTILDPLLSFCEMDPDITFAEYEARTGKRLHIFATDYTNMEVFRCSPTATPDMSVKLAAKMSCSVPGLFVPVEHEGRQFVDGYVFAHYPLQFAQEDALAEGDPRSILGLHFDYDAFLSPSHFTPGAHTGDADVPGNNVASFFVKFTSAVMRKLRELVEEKWRARMEALFRRGASPSGKGGPPHDIPKLDRWLDEHYMGVALPCKDVQRLAFDTLFDEDLRVRLIQSGRDFVREIFLADNAKNE
jgi:predicted acylesterase/phospholipase RssA